MVLPYRDGRTDIMALIELLDLEARVAAAEPLIPSWDLQHPNSVEVTSSAEIRAALLIGSPRENDPLLLRLAELASVDGGASLDAAAVLAMQVLPGVAARLRGLSRLRSRRVLEEHAAAVLWIACRTFPFRTRHWVASTISWQVYRATFHELGDRGDGRTWASTVVAGDPAWWADKTVPDDEHTAPADDLADLLAWALSTGVLSSADDQFLAVLLRTVALWPAARVSSHGLLSGPVCRAVAVQCGVGVSTVKRRVAQIVASLREASPAYLTAMAS
jgi:hypothetical protein